MTPSRIRVAALLVFAVAALALAACGSDDSSSSASSEASTSTAAAGQAGGSNGTVDLADNGALGTEILVDDEGRTLYLFEKDDSADESYCYDACAEAWPPLTSSGTVTVGSGLDASQLTTFERDDGSTQLAYAGHPLYLYAGDKAPGDANGNELDQFGAEWYAMDSSGEAVESGGSSDDDPTEDTTSEDSSTDDSTSEDSTGGGYSSY